MNPLLHPIWWLKISAAIGRRNHHHVIELSKKAILKYPDNAVPYGFLVSHLDALGEVEPAKEYARKALSIDPDNFDLHSFMIRNLDPVEDQNEIIEHAKWLVAIAETTLSQGDREMEKTLSSFERIPMIGKHSDDARQYLSEHRQEQVALLRWAKAFLSSRND